MQLKIFKFLLGLFFVIFTFSNSSAEHIFLKRLKDGSIEQRIKAIYSLGYAKSKAGFWYYVKYLNYQPDQGELTAVLCRSAAAEALGRIKDKRAIKFLIERYKKEKNDSVKERIVFAFGFYTDPQLIPLVKSALNSKNKDLKTQAILTAAKMNEKSFLPEIKQIFNTEKDVAVQCTAAFAAIRYDKEYEKYAAKLKEYLINKDPFVRLCAAEYLALSAQISAISDLQRAIKIENKEWVKENMQLSLYRLLELKKIINEGSGGEFDFITDSLYDKDKDKENEKNKSIDKNLDVE